MTTAGRVGLLALLGAVAAPRPALGQTVVVLMFDGFSPAMIEVEPTPALDAMRREGAWTHALEPAFPTISLPNQISLSTGCWPERHGIVSNLFIDPERGEYDHATDPDWLLACEHLHQVAERQGVRSAALWWLGAHSARDGPLATYVAKPEEDPASPHDVERGRRVVELLRLPVSERPRLILAYFTEPDMTAHFEGIGSPKTRARIRESDAVVGAVLAELRRLRADGEPVSLFVTTDHGMLEVQAIVNVERILRRHGLRARFTSVGTTSFLYFESAAERDRALAALSGYAQFDVYRRDALPGSWHLGTSPRIGDLTLSAHPPFFIENIDEWPWWARWLGRWGPEFIKARTVLKATHGYPGNVPGMSGFLYAWGDGIGRGWIDGLRAVDLHPAVAALLGVEPGSPVDGVVPPSLVVGRATPEP